MRAEKSKTKTSAVRPSYRQGKKKIYVEPLKNTFAVQGKADRLAAVSEALRPFGALTTIEPRRLLILTISDEANRDEALRVLQRLVDAGDVEFFTPVLRDEESQLHQILTDEISVRFKKPLPSKALKAVEKKYGVKIARRNEFVPNQFVVKAAQPTGLRTLEVASQLDSADEVEFATPNFISEHKR